MAIKPPIQKSRYTHPETHAPLTRIDSVVEGTRNPYAWTEYASNIAVAATLANTEQLLRPGGEDYVSRAQHQARLARRRRGVLSRHIHDVISHLAHYPADTPPSWQAFPPLPADPEGWGVVGRDMRGIL